MYFRHLSHLFTLAKTSALLLTALSSAGQTAPFAYTQPVGPVSSTNVTLNGMVTPNGALAVAWFEWGTGQVLDQVTPAMSVGSGTSVVRVSAFVDGLTSNADYRCRLVASNVNGVAMDLRIFSPRDAGSPLGLTTPLSFELVLHRRAWERW